MGTDIHPLLEIKVDNKWEAVRDSYSVIREDYNGEENVSIYLGPHKTDFYFGRCYTSFSILAGVRNWYRDDCSSSDSVYSCIDRPRGIPVDSSEIFKQACTEWMGDAHSHSYLYLKELNEWLYENRIPKEELKELRIYRFIQVMNKYAEENNLCPVCIRLCFFFDN